MRQPKPRKLPAQFGVVLDANELFPFTLRDTLLRAAEARVYQLHWSETILEEVGRNLVATGATTEERAARLVTIMRDAFPDRNLPLPPLVQALRQRKSPRGDRARARPWLSRAARRHAAVFDHDELGGKIRTMALGRQTAA